MFLSPDSEFQSLFQLNAVTVTYRTYPEVGGDSRRAELARALARQFGWLPTVVWASQQGELGLEDLCVMRYPLSIQTFLIKSVEDGKSKFSFR